MILITGGAGFIGSNLLARLEERGIYDVVVCDTFGRGNKWRNLAKHAFANMIAPDRLFHFLENNSRDIEVVFHLGANTNTMDDDADQMVANNFIFGMDLWNWCFRQRSRLIYLSSASVYGDGSMGFSDENSLSALKQLKPISLYGWTKHIFDKRVVRIMETGGVARPPQWVGFRAFNTYGPNEYHKGAMQSLITKSFEDVARGKPVDLFKSLRSDVQDGGQRRDFIWVDDVVDAMIWAYENKNVNGLFNLGTGRGRSMNEVVEVVSHVLGRPKNINYIDTPINLKHQYQNVTEADMTRLREAGFNKPFMTLEEGVQLYLEKYLSQKDPYR